MRPYRHQKGGVPTIYERRDPCELPTYRKSVDRSIVRSYGIGTAGRKPMPALKS